MPQFFANCYVTTYLFDIHNLFPNHSFWKSSKRPALDIEMTIRSKQYGAERLCSSTFEQSYLRVSFFTDRAKHYRAVLQNMLHMKHLISLQFSSINETVCLVTYWSKKYISTHVFYTSLLGNHHHNQLSRFHLYENTG